MLLVRNIGGILELHRAHKTDGSFPCYLCNDKQEQLLLSCLDISLSKSNFVRIINSVNPTYIANCELFFFSKEVVKETQDC